MGAFDDNVAIIGDWVIPPNPSPRAFFSDLLGDEFSSRSIPEPSIQTKNGGIFPWSQGQIISQKTDDKDQLTDSSLSSGQKMNPRGGLLERMAARAGFNAPRLNTESIRPVCLSQNQDNHSPFTIPPGLSPTTLLESPVFLSNSQVQPSPTTGKLSFAPSGSGRNSMLGTEAPSRTKDNFFEDISAATSSFALKHVAESGPHLSLSDISGHTSNVSMITWSNLPQRNFPGSDVPVKPENYLWYQNIEPNKVESLDQTTLLHLWDSSRKVAQYSPPPNEQQDEESDQRGGEDDTVVGGGPMEDGYNWRKYGKKQVKGSENPRSYFKCTHLNCPVKKKVEQACDGQITKIMYRGTHNHAIPAPNRRLAIGSDLQVDIDDQSEAHIVVDGDPRWTTIRNGTTDGACDWSQYNLEVASSVSMGAEYCNTPTCGTHSESSEAVDACSTFTNDEEEDDNGTHGGTSVDYDGEEDESKSKKRKIEAYATETIGATRPLREPRVVVQTTSEVDILDDGYRWRKYGQKVVKGNPNPRSYYKCTSTGCTVRKHVERAPHDLKSVITTYEGKHNHDVPAARNGSSIAPNNGPAQGAGAGSGSVSARLHRPELFQPRNSMARFDLHSGLSSQGLPIRQQPRLGPHNGFGFGMNQPGISDLAMARLGSRPGQTARYFQGNNNF